MLDKNVSELIPFRVETIRRKFLPSEGLCWTDLLVLTAIDHLGKESTPVMPADVIVYLSMNRVWVYQSLKRLQLKKLIDVYKRQKNPSVVHVNGWGKTMILGKVEDILNGIEVFIPQRSRN